MGPGRAALKPGLRTPRHSGLDPESMNTGMRELDTNRVHGWRIKSAMTIEPPLPASPLRAAHPGVGAVVALESDASALLAEEDRLGLLPDLAGIPVVDA